MFFLTPPKTVDVVSKAGRQRIPFAALDIGDLSTDVEIKAAICQHLGEALEQHHVLRFPGQRVLVRVPLVVRLAAKAPALGRRLQPLGRALAAMLGPPFRLLVGTIEKVDQGLQRLVRWLQPVEAGLGKFFRRLIEGVQPVLDRVGQGLSGLFHHLVERPLTWLIATLWNGGALVLERVFLPLTTGLFERVLTPLAGALHTYLLAPPAAAVQRLVLAPAGRAWRRLGRRLGPWVKGFQGYLFGVVQRWTTGLTDEQLEQDHRVTMMETLLRTPHRQLQSVYPVHQQVAEQDPIFYRALAAWYFQHGEGRDHQEMFVVLLCLADDLQSREVGLALLRRLPPYQVGRVLDFVRGRVHKGKRVGLFRNPPRSLRKEVQRYLKQREQDQNAFDGAVLAARAALKRLYTTLHVRPGPYAQAVLFDGEPPEGSRVWALKQLANCGDDGRRAELIRTYRLPFRALMGALKEPGPESAEALLEQMTPQEVINSMATFKRRGWLDGPMSEIVGAKLEQGKRHRRVSTFKSNRAAQADLGREWQERLQQVTEAQLSRRGQIKTRTAVLVDASASMEPSLEIGKRVASMLAAVCEETPLVLTFAGQARRVSCEGEGYAAWEETFASVQARGPTSVGAALLHLYRNRSPVQQLVIITDQHENQRPRFASSLRLLRRRLRHPRLVFVTLPGGVDTLAAQARRQRVEVESYRFGGDYYALPDLLPILSRPTRLDLLMEVLETELPQRH